jgi:hypothetical protein
MSIDTILQVDQLVMVQVKQIAEMGAYVKLVSRVVASSELETDDRDTLAALTAGVRQHRGNDSAVRAVSSPDKIRSKVDPSRTE